MQFNKESLQEQAKMDPSLMFLLHDSLNSNVEYLRTELVRQVSLARSAQAEANKFQSLYQRGEEASRILKNIRADVQKVTDAVKKDLECKLERKYAERFHQYTMESEETEKLHRQMQNEITSLREQVETRKTENEKLSERNSELSAQVQDLQTALVQEEAQRNNLLVYIEDVLKANNLTLSSPQRNSFSTLSASFNLITSPAKKLEFVSSSEEKEKVDSLLLLKKNIDKNNFVESIDSVTSNEMQNHAFKAASTPTEATYENCVPANLPKKVRASAAHGEPQSQKNHFLSEFEVLEAQQIFDELSEQLEKSIPEYVSRGQADFSSSNSIVNKKPQSKRGFLGFYRKLTKESEPNPSKRLSFFRNPFRRGFYV